MCTHSLLGISSSSDKHNAFEVGGRERRHCTLFPPQTHSTPFTHAKNGEKNPIWENGREEERRMRRLQQQQHFTECQLMCPNTFDKKALQVSALN